MAGGEFTPPNHQERKSTNSPSMKAARVERRGDAAFELVDVPIPQPGAGQLLIRVEAAAVNFSDVKRRRGDP